MENETYKRLKEFTEFVKELLDEGIRKGDIKKIEVNENYLRYKVTNFRYSIEEGVKTDGIRGSQVTEKRFIFKHDSEKIIKQSQQYKDLIVALKNKFNIDKLEYDVNLFLGRLTNDYLDNNRIDENLINIFLKELNDKPVKIFAKAEIDGITLESDSIDISKSVRLRRVKIEDIEKDEPIYPHPFTSGHFMHYVSAIMEISKYGHTAAELQKDIEKYITILRLFKVGSVYYISYKMSSEAISYFVGGTVTTNLTFPSAISYIIYNKDLDKLKNFFHELDMVLPEKFYGWEDSVGNEHLFFAYKRYWEAISTKGSYEQQMANSIIGLEALYLNDSQEISRFLRLRISKFLSLAGFEPYRIRKVLRDAYEVRSYFIHGNQLSYKIRRKLQDKYATENNLLSEVLDYLRVSIVLLLILKKQKDELIDLIDDIFIDKKKEEELRNQVGAISKRLNLIEVDKNATL